MDDKYMNEEIENNQDKIKYQLFNVASLEEVNWQGKYVIKVLASL